uniref:Phospholipase/carboxylesterase/thioesterase domain-containing protein n=1 Tax=Tetraselmis chuii TaxID=63592 RepID=A0A7S1X842_9CHLO|mmetsp:Transcript_41905/g.75248  ORF Transcript_41905/g.75248 Transcript_41905/m.75248 type:complete len:298 (+) Transcript_41905:411-1304(+)
MSQTRLAAFSGGVASLQRALGSRHPRSTAVIAHSPPITAHLGQPGKLCVQPSKPPGAPRSLSAWACRPGRSIVAAMSSLSYPKPTVFEAKGEHKATVIILHGLGDTAAGWASMGRQFAMPGTKFIFPTAPMRPITLNMGMVMTGWYDITSLDKINAQEDVEGIKESWRYVEGLIQAEEEKGIPTDKIVVAGFSQGGVVAMMGARSSKKLAGIVGMSTYMPLREEEPVLSAENMSTPILMCHGERDMVVAYEYGKGTAEKLKQLGADVTFTSYAYMGHEACLEELEEVKGFLSKVTGN